MIKECALVTDILFNMDYLRKLDIDLPKLTDEVIKTRGETKAKELGFDPSIQPDKTVSENIFEAPSAVQTASSHHRSHLRQALGRVIHIPEKYNQDLLAALFDQLEMAKPWWVLEFIPMLGTYQLPNGTWIRKRMSVDLVSLDKLVLTANHLGATLVKEDIYPFSRAESKSTSRLKRGLTRRRVPRNLTFLPPTTGRKQRSRVCSNMFRDTSSRILSLV